MNYCGPANLNIYKQCPQIYIYIFTVITSVLIALKYGTMQQVTLTLLSGAISTFILMGINMCSWSFQWFSWLLAAIWIIVATSNILIFFNGASKEDTDRIITL